VTDRTLVLFTRYGMGEAPAELQHKLAAIFLNILSQDTAPGAIAFYGDGVKLACEGSPVLEQLRALAAWGVTLVLCQTCLDYYGPGRQSDQRLALSDYTCLSTGCRLTAEIAENAEKNLRPLRAPLSPRTLR
jgi:hypothetical protein